MQRYTKVKTLIRMLQKEDPEASLFIEATLPPNLRKLAPYLNIELNKPKLYDAYTDIDGSKHVWLRYSITLSSG